MNESNYPFAICDICGESDCDCENTASHSVKDESSNEIMGVYGSDDGCIDFYINGALLTSWVCEDDPEVTFNEFMLIWNKAQASIKENK